MAPSTLLLWLYYVDYDEHLHLSDRWLLQRFLGNFCGFICCRFWIIHSPTQGVRIQDAHFSNTEIAGTPFLSSQFPLQPKDYCLLYGRNDDKMSRDMTYSTDKCVSSVSVSARDSQKELAGCGSSSVVLFSIMPTRRLETWRVHTLADASPLGEFYRRGHVVSHQLHIRAHGEALELPGKASMAGDCVSTSCPNRNN